MEIDVEIIKNFINNLPDPEKFKFNSYTDVSIENDISIKFVKRNFTDGSVRWVLDIPE